MLNLECDLLLACFWEQGFEGLEQGVCFGVALPEVERLGRRRIDFAGRFGANLSFEFRRPNLFAPSQHFSAGVCRASVCVMDLEEHDIGAWFWDDFGRDLVCEICGEEVEDDFQFFSALLRCGVGPESAKDKRVSFFSPQFLPINFPLRGGGSVVLSGWLCGVSGLGL